MIRADLHSMAQLGGFDGILGSKPSGDIDAALCSDEKDQLPLELRLKTLLASKRIFGQSAVNAAVFEDANDCPSKPVVDGVKKDVKTDDVVKEEDVICDSQDHLCFHSANFAREGRESGVSQDQGHSDMDKCPYCRISESLNSIGTHADSYIYSNVMSSEVSTGVDEVFTNIGTSPQHSVPPNISAEMKIDHLDDGLASSPGDGIIGFYSSDTEAVEIKNEVTDDCVDELDHMSLRVRKRMLWSRKLLGVKESAVEGNSEQLSSHVLGLGGHAGMNTGGGHSISGKSLVAGIPFSSITMERASGLYGISASGSSDVTVYGSSRIVQQCTPSVGSCQREESTKSRNYWRDQESGRVCSSMDVNPCHKQDIVLALPRLTKVKDEALDWNELPNSEKSGLANSRHFRGAHEGNMNCTSDERTNPVNLCSKGGLVPDGLSVPCPKQDIVLALPRLTKVKDEALDWNELPNSGKSGLANSRHFIGAHEGNMNCTSDERTNPVNLCSNGGLVPDGLSVPCPKQDIVLALPRYMKVKDEALDWNGLPNSGKSGLANPRHFIEAHEGNMNCTSDERTNPVNLCSKQGLVPDGLSVACPKQDIVLALPRLTEVKDEALDWNELPNSGKSGLANSWHFIGAHEGNMNCTSDERTNPVNLCSKGGLVPDGLSVPCPKQDIVLALPRLTKVKDEVLDWNELPNSGKSGLTNSRHFIGAHEGSMNCTSDERTNPVNLCSKGGLVPDGLSVPCPKQDIVLALQRLTKVKDEALDWNELPNSEKSGLANSRHFIGAHEGNMNCTSDERTNPVNLCSNGGLVPDGLSVPCPKQDNVLALPRLTKVKDEALDWNELPNSEKSGLANSRHFIESHEGNMNCTSDERTNPVNSRHFIGAHEGNMNCTSDERINLVNLCSKRGLVPDGLSVPCPKQDNVLALARLTKEKEEALDWNELPNSEKSGLANSRHFIGSHEGNMNCTHDERANPVNLCSKGSLVPDGLSVPVASALSNSVTVRDESVVTNEFNAIGNGSLAKSSRDLYSLKTELQTPDENLVDFLDHMTLQDRFLMLVSRDKPNISSSSTPLRFPKIVPSFHESQTYGSKPFKPNFEKRSRKRKRTCTDSIETALEEDAPGLVQILVDRGVSMDEIKLYGEPENDSTLDDCFIEDNFSELEAVISKIFSQRQSLLKFAPIRCTKGAKATYCLACLVSLVEQTRYLRFRKWPVEWGWCRDLHSFIFVFERHNRIVLERPEYGYATYFFEIASSLSIQWQIKRLVTAMKLTNFSRISLIENKSLLVGEDLSEGEAKVLMEYGWQPNSGLGTMLNYQDRVVHDKRSEVGGEWRSKIGKLLADGYNSGTMISKKDMEYTGEQSSEVKLEY